MEPPTSAARTGESAIGAEIGTPDPTGNGAENPFANDVVPEIMAEDFEPPAQLGPEDLDEPKKQALFS